MISLRRWGLWKPYTKTRADQNGQASEAIATLSPAQSTRPAASGRTMPRPALRWVAEGRVALRAFDFDSDSSAVCAFQPETYSLNFPHFTYTPNFADAFRHDLRRAVLDPHNAIFVLDDGREKNSIVGFLWVVICQNNWTQERYGYVNNLYVVPQRRGQGLAKELLRQGDDWFRARGIRRVRLTVTSSNPSASGLYEASGFHVQRHEMEKQL